MDVGSVINQGLIGMQQSRSEIVRSAEQINQAAQSGGAQDVIEPIVNMTIQQQVFDGSARVVEVGSSTLGTLLDVKA